MDYSQQTKDELIRELEDLHRELAEARRDQQTLKALMECIPEGVTISDAPDVHIRMVSRYGQGLTGRPREAIEGIPVEEHAQKWAIYQPDGLTPARSEELPLTRATRQGEIVTDEEWVLERPDGTKVTILCNAGPVRDEEGCITGGVIAWRDITERKQAEEAMRESEERFRLLFEQAPIPYQSLDDEGRILYVNPTWLDALGYRQEEVVGRWFGDFLAPSSLATFEERFPCFKDLGEVRGVEFEMVRKDGAHRFVSFNGRIGHDLHGHFLQTHCVFEDVTERKRAERRLRRENHEMSVANRILKAFVEESGNDLYDKTLDIMLEAMESLHGVFGYIDDQGDLICPTMSRLFPTCEMENKCVVYPLGKWKEAWSRALVEGRTLYSNKPARVPPGHVPVRNNLAAPILFQGRVIGLFNFANKPSDYTEEDREFIEAVSARIAPILYARIQIEMRTRERELAEQAVRKSERRYRLLSETAGRLLTSDDPQGIVDDLCRGVMEHLDCQAFFNFLVDERAGRLHLNACAGIPEEEARRIEWLDFGVAVCGCAAQSGERIVAEDILHTPDLRTELVKSYGIQAYACHPLLVQDRVIGTLSFGTTTRPSFLPEELDLMKVVADQVATAMERMRLIEALTQARDGLELRVRERTSDLQRANAELQAQTARLEMVNAELQEFAFVASHDLQEPLRKIQSFSDRLRGKCADSLGEEGCDYLNRVQGAAARMSKLLTALLAYSRVATRGQPFAPVDLTRTAVETVSDLEIAIEEAGATVEIGPLPILEADADQMRQLLQNLIGNGLKYRSEEERPLIRVHGLVENGSGQILVEDNGIGFDEKYLDRIFRPFQRLHGRSSPYEGTGMGLAIVRKIAERHGGSVTATSVPGQGSTFIVTLPVKQQGIGTDDPPPADTGLFGMDEAR